MRQGTVFSALVLLVGLLAGTATAEHLVTMEVEPPIVVGKEPAEKETYRIWIGDSRLREDRKNRSMIVDREAGKMYVIKHADKTFYALDLPIDFESMVPENMRVQWRTVLKARQADVTISGPTDAGEVRGHAVKKYEAVIADRNGSETRLTMWTTTTPGFDTATYKDLMTEIHALQPSSAEWVRKLFEAVEGYPVRLTRSASMPDGDRVWTEEMVSVEEKAAPQGTWKPADGYTEIEFNLLSVPPE